MTKPEDWNESLNPLIGALRRGHYLLYCQTIKPINPALVNGRPYQEILIRYLEEDTRLLPPGMFFPILQEQGLMALLDCWVVAQVLRLQDLGMRAQSGWVRPRSSINVAEDSVLDPEFSQFVISQLEKWNPPADTLCFEVLEQVAVAQPVALEELASVLASRGCGFALGSFKGTGAGMDLLTGLPINYVKIDGTLVRKILTHPAKRAHVVRINQRCHELGIQTVAELVEEPEVLEAVAEIGIDHAQGFGVELPAPFLAAQT
jgi:EAL domain-containing protein (putative c-di-GMP-specific phosphodiesterase class I)